MCLILYKLTMFVSIFMFVFAISSVNGIKWNAFSTQTAYEWSHDLKKAVVEDALFTINQPGKTCKAIHVNGVYRHGARNPTKEDIGDIDELIKKLKDNKKVGSFPFIDTWTNPYKLESESDLVDEGKKEMARLGTRMETGLGSLLRNNAANLEFTSSGAKRCIESGNIFAKALWSDRSATVDDNRMRFYIGCKNHEEKIVNNAANFIEFTTFNSGDKFLDVSNSMKASLGLNISLSTEQIYMVYFLCAFGKYINNQTVWCQLMSDSEREILEYGQDIQYSYGNTLNTKLACPLVSDMFLTMDAAMNDDWKYTSTGVTDYSGKSIDNSGYLAGKFQFGHLGATIRLETILGLFKDSLPLLANNMEQMSNRNFKTSKTNPYAGNLVFIVYACDSTANMNSTNTSLRDREYYIKLLVNEEPVTIPGCGSDTCLYSTVRNMYKDHIDNCNIRALCNNDSPIDIVVG